MKFLRKLYFIFILFILYPYEALALYVCEGGWSEGKIGPVYYTYCPTAPQDARYDIFLLLNIIFLIAPFIFLFFGLIDVLSKKRKVKHWKRGRIFIFTSIVLFLFDVAIFYLLR